MKEMIPEVEGMNAEIDDTLEDSTVPKSVVRSHARQVKSGINIFIPYDVLKLPAVVAAATRLGMTPADQSTFTTALISACGGDITKVRYTFCK
jgi:hypothetical protein